MKVKQFTIEESKANKNMMILVAETEDGKKWVVAGDHWNPTALDQYETNFHVMGVEAHAKMVNGKT